MLEASKFAQVVREFQLYKLDILGLSEIIWANSGETKAASGETLIFSCKPSTEKVVWVFFSAFKQGKG